MNPAQYGLSDLHLTQKPRFVMDLEGLRSGLHRTCRNLAAADNAPL